MTAEVVLWPLRACACKYIHTPHACTWIDTHSHSPPHTHTCTRMSTQKHTRAPIYLQRPHSTTPIGCLKLHSTDTSMQVFLCTTIHVSSFLFLLCLNYYDENNLKRNGVYSAHGSGIVHHHGKVRAAKAHSRWSHYVHSQRKKVMSTGCSSVPSLCSGSPGSPAQGMVFPIIKMALPISINITKIIPHKMLSS